MQNTRKGVPIYLARNRRVKAFFRFSSSQPVQQKAAHLFFFKVERMVTMNFEGDYQTKIKMSDIFSQFNFIRSGVLPGKKVNRDAVCSGTVNLAT